MNDMHSAGVDTNIVSSMEKGMTGKCLVMVSKDAERTMNTYLGVSETLSEKDLYLTAIESSEYIYIEGYLVTSDSARDAAVKASSYARSKGVKTAVTFSDPAMVKYFKNGLKEMTGAGVDLLFCNREEASIWCESENTDDIIAGLKKTASQFCMTTGSEGAIVFDGEKLIRIAPNRVQAVDTTGAGDLFAGSFIYGITHGMDFAKAGALASLASSKVVERFGPRLSPEEHKEIFRLFQKNL
jgi:fructokinase